ncbi:MAG: hypothetical protein U0075_24805 [Thermomicrobiales bacterium]
MAIASLIGEFTTEWNQVMAAAAIGTVPVVIVFLFFQKQLMHGLTGGAVKARDRNRNRYTGIGEQSWHRLARLPASAPWWWALAGAITSLSCSTRVTA